MSPAHGYSTKPKAVSVTGSSPRIPKCRMGSEVLFPSMPLDRVVAKGDPEFIGAAFVQLDIDYSAKGPGNRC